MILCLVMDEAMLLEHMSSLLAHRVILNSSTKNLVRLQRGGVGGLQIMHSGAAALAPAHSR
jgi:hypothetical protein